MFRMIPLCTPAASGPGCVEHGAGCSSPGKVPLQSDWAARGDTTKPDGNYGILTGPVSDLLVIDVDTEDSAAVFAGWDLPETLTVRSGRSSGVGRHFYYRWPADLVRVPNRLDGVELKGPGRQVVGPGSMHPSGRRYEIERDLPLAELPEAFVARIAEAVTQKARRDRTEDATVEALEALERFVEHLPGGAEEQADGNLVAICPAHNDHDPSLVLTASGDRVLAYCRAGCSAPDIVAAVGLDMNALYAPTVTLDDDTVLGHPLTDAGNALRLVDRHGGRLRYVGPWKDWVAWDGRRWVRDRFGSAMEAAKDVATAIWEVEAPAEPDSDKRARISKWALQSEGANRLEAMVKLARSDPRALLNVDDLDRSPWILNCENGTLDLRTGELRPHDPDDHLTRITLAPYLPGAAAPRWDAFLERVLPNAEVRAYVQRVCGMALTGANPERVMFVFHGDGRNGKTVIAETMQQLLGDYAGPINKDALIERRSGQIRNDLADARGRRLVISSETEEGEKLSVAEVKAITGGDSISVRRLYENQFSFRPEFKVWLLTNYLPRVTDSGVATWDRLRVIPFTVRIGDDEVVPLEELLAAFRAEAAGVLAWAVRGCTEWQRIGLAEPMDVVLAAAAWSESEDVVGQFITESTAEDDDGFISSSELYKAYCVWCAENGHRPMSLKRLSPMLQKRGFSRCRESAGGRRKGYCGRAFTADGARLASGQAWRDA